MFDVRKISIITLAAIIITFLETMGIINIINGHSIIGIMNISIATVDIFLCILNVSVSINQCKGK